MAIRIWSEETGTFVEPEDILTCGPDGVYYSVPQINAPAADGTWGQVWPVRKYIIQDGKEMQGYTAKAVSALNATSPGQERRTPDIKRNQGNLQLSQVKYQSAWFYGGIVVFGSNIYDLSGFRTLCVDCSSYRAPNYSYIYTGVFPSMPPSDGTLNFTKCISTYGNYGETVRRKVYRLDISKIQSGLIGVAISGPSYEAASATTHIEIFNLWLEP